MELQESIQNLKTTISGKGNFFEFDKESLAITNSQFIISGTNNKIVVGKNSKFKNLKISIKGNNNLIYIGDNCNLTGSISAHDDSQTVQIGSKTSFVDVTLLAQEGKNITIGEDCMFSRNIVIRTTDGHSVIDLNTNERINQAKDIHIGNHVWIGANVTILKGINIPDDTIIAGNTLVTKSFDESNTILGGTPANVIKTGVTWIRKRI